MKLYNNLLYVHDTYTPLLLSSSYQFKSIFQCVVIPFHPIKKPLPHMVWNYSYCNYCWLCITFYIIQTTFEIIHNLCSELLVIVWGGSFLSYLQEPCQIYQIIMITTNCHISVSILIGIFIFCFQLCPKINICNIFYLK